MKNEPKSYPEYKPSGLPWLGDVPEHWEVQSLGSLTTLLAHRGRPDLPLLSVVRERGVIPRSITGDDDNHNFIPDDLSNYKVAHAGNLVINKMKAWQGSLGIAPTDGIVSPAYFVLDFRIDEHRFGHVLLRSKPYAALFAQASDGVRIGQWDLRIDRMKRIPVVVPPVDEQRAIVRYLDTLDRKIRRFIRNKRRLIELLNEQKQGIINQAVTRGLDPNVKMKDSGVEWLGEVPEGWTLKRFKFVARINQGQVDPRQEPYNSYMLIAPNHIEKRTGKLLSEETAGEQGADSGKYLVKKGQIIYSKIRPNLQKATLAPRDCLCSADMYGISPRFSEICPEYLLLLLLSEPVSRYAVDCSLRVAMPKVNREALGNCWLWYPSLCEQQEIVNSLPRQTASIDSAITRTQREIDLIREYRTRLIADVVTGKVDVRGIAAEASMEEGTEMFEELDEEAVHSEESAAVEEES